MVGPPTAGLKACTTTVPNGRHNGLHYDWCSADLQVCRHLRLKQSRIQAIVRRLPQIDERRGLRGVLDRQMTTSLHGAIEIRGSFRQHSLSIHRADDAEADGGG